MTKVNLPIQTNISSQTGIIDSDFSKRITTLRFALASFVVFIHNNIAGSIHFADNDVTINMPLWITIIYNTMHSYWGGIAVPTFFIISGYLFFAKPKPVSVSIKSKSKGIIVPYLLWTVLSIALFFIAQCFEISKPYFAQPERIIRNWGVSDYLKSLWAMDIAANPSTLHHPFVGQFWYLRNLILVMLLSPIIKYLAKKFPVSWFIFVTLLYTAEMLHITNIQYGITTALFYFTLGYYAVNKISKVMKLIDSIKWRDYIMAYGLSLLLTAYADINKLAGSSFIIWFNLLFTISLVIKIAGVISKKEKIYKKLSFLSGFAFWVYAGHLPLVLNIIKKLSVQIIPMHGILILVQYFGVSIACICLLLISGIILKKTLPNVYVLFNGR